MFYLLDLNEWRQPLQLYKIHPNTLIWTSSSSYPIISQEPKYFWPETCANCWTSCFKTFSGLTKTESRWLFPNSQFSLFRIEFFLKKVFLILINLWSRFRQSFTNLAQEMNVLYSAEQKGWPLGSQALVVTDIRHCHRSSYWLLITSHDFSWHLHSPPETSWL